MPHSAHALEDVTTMAIRRLEDDQIHDLIRRVGDVTIMAHALDLLRMDQLMQLAAGVAIRGIEQGTLRLTIGTDRMNEGLLDYKLEGDMDYLSIITDEMAHKGVQPFEKDTTFHQISATITGAQLLAADIDEEKATPVLEKGAALSDLAPNTEERARKTKEFLDELFAFISVRLPRKAA
jgi:hypothetical protein